MLVIDFPSSLPVSERKDELMQAIRQHQVVVVCGETGSGKTTQLPKMLLALQQQDQAKANAGGKVKTKQLIGHTQPRRIAAAAVAKRIAAELNTPLGEVVGYKVRFQDHLQPGAAIKLMTDGILLAETQTDPLLQAYSAIIIDEAHERSLNIDFLLGYLKQILPKRPDLKIIITSATIDANRFARHFSYAKHKVPALLVSGRLYPVEQRYREFEESKDYGLTEAIADAVDELWDNPSQSGDILVFLPGEREIRMAQEKLQQHLSASALGRDAEVIPLFARLSQTEQERIFQSSNRRRIILATNVAETSLTVPGIRYVIDSGLARVKRYSYRNKIEHLQIEKISQAAANQRAGRCGRVANGICIRLYDEADYLARSAFTDPEILRSSLTAVILRMKALRLSDIESFPFIEPPQQRAIVDGYQQLQELGALTSSNELTKIGRLLAKLPLDPRVARMLLEAQQRQALQEMLIIASALSVQDVRDRPLEAQAQADQAHAKFNDPKSEFTSYLKLWQWLNDSRGEGKVSAAKTVTTKAKPQSTKAKASAANAAATNVKPRLTNRQYEALLRKNFISIRRVREWRDIYQQLAEAVKQQRWQLNKAPASYEQLHLSLLSGLLGNIGCKSEQEDWYLGAHGVKFYPHPGSTVKKKTIRWLIAAEQVNTTRLYGRCLAAIEPKWLEQIGAHLLRKQVVDPHWERKAGQVVALERATIYGVEVYRNRRIAYAQLDPIEARNIFIRQALLGENIDSKLAFLSHNKKVLAKVEQLEHKSRRQDVLVDDELIYAFYDQQLPQDVCNLPQLEHWYRAAAKSNPRLLFLELDDLKRHQAADVTSASYPKYIRLGGVDCKAGYWYEPGNSKDGLTVDVPVYILNQVDQQRCQWLVAGMLQEKVQALLKGLPPKIRSRLNPLAGTSKIIAADLAAVEKFAKQPLIQAIVDWVREHKQLDLKAADFKTEMLSIHLLMNFRVLNEHGRQLGIGRNLTALKKQFGNQARGAFQQLASMKTAVPAAATKSEPKPKQSLPSAASQTAPAAAAANAVMDATLSYTKWDFAELPELLEILHGKQQLIGFPAIIDQQTAVSIQVFDEPEVARSKHRAGLRRLFALQIKDALRYLEKNLAQLQPMAMQYISLGTADELKQQIIQLALDQAFLTAPLPTNATEFSQRIQQGRAKLNLIAQEIAKLAGTILQEYQLVLRKLKEHKQPEATLADIKQQLQHLLPKHFLTEIAWIQLKHYPRYLKGIVLRLDKLKGGAQRDLERLASLRLIEQNYWRLLSQRQGVVDEKMHEFRWMLEEQRISFFAQELRTPYPVSIKRLEKLWSQILA